MTITRGDWHHFELLVGLASTTSGYDGTFDLWMEGEHISHYTNIGYVKATDGSNVCTHCIFDPISGGGPNAAKHEMYIEEDHVYISGR